MTFFNEHKKAIIILLTCTVVVFFNSLFNDFIGDDEVLITQNEFYTTWLNVPKLFTKDYLTTGSDLLSGGRFNHTGSVAYRPVLCITYFIDYALWKLNPFGYHLTNLLLHTANVLMVYFLIMAVMKNQPIALISALLFSIHPTKSEAVCSIGYRADPLSSFFLLISILLYLKFSDQFAKHRKMFYVCSILSYALALFTKESAILLPAILMAYDWFFQKFSIKEIFKNLKSRYLPFVLTSLFYLYVYVFVFPNTTLGVAGFIGNHIGIHVITMLWIFALYMFDLFLPFSVVVLPPQYAPSMQTFFLLKGICGVGIFVFYIFMIYKSFRKLREISFFLIWFLLFLIPVANIVPNPNPIAHRFLYFPSIGISVVFAWLIQQLSFKISSYKLKNLPNLVVLVKGAIIGLCMVTTFFLNINWKNNFSIASSTISDYPDYHFGYTILGLEFFKAHAFPEAEKALKKSEQLGSQDPRIYHVLGICTLNNIRESQNYFDKAIKLNPGYASPYIGLGRTYFYLKEYEKAVIYLEKSVAINPTYTGCGYLIQAYLKLGRVEEAKKILKVGIQHLSNEGQITSLKKFIEKADDLPGFVDIGI